MTITRMLGAALATAVTATTLAATATTAEAAPPKKKFTVTVTSAPKVVQQGDRVVIRGTVRPGTKGDKVELQIRYAGGAWKTTKMTDKLDGKRRFVLMDKVSSTKTRSYRVLRPASRTRKASTSKVLPVTVYSWRYLTQLSPVSGSSTYEYGSASINGVAYGPSVRADAHKNDGKTEYNLLRRCTQLSTRVGLDDTSEITATGTARLELDGTEKFTGSYQLTQSQPLLLDVTNVFRLTFEWASTNTEGTPTDQSGAVVTLAAPRILCRD
ncbi:hypothetical protein [Nocardioides sp. SYSU D00038]|uniref:hypothetical protein n=1 Tax=Nocardioides sp. SYSU D00038 TaxID=2812554 RepID=UPI00196708C0|nr:hypothetical protein [Nocardioides sp. SYSU D00038]